MTHSAGLHTHALLDELPVLAWTSRPDGSVNYVNRTWCTYTGMAAAESVDKGWAAAVHPDDLGPALQEWEGALANAQPLATELRLRRADGVFRWHLANTHPLRDAQGRLTGWCGTSTDIEARRQSFDQATAQARATRLVIDTIPGHLLTHTPDGTVEFASRRFSEDVGATPDALRNWRIGDGVHPDDRERVTSEWQRHRATGQPCEMVMRVRRADGSYRLFQYRARPAHDASGRIVRWYLVGTDMEDLKRTHDSLRRTQLRLAQQAQLAALSELSASIAHEVNQPLAAVIANSHALQRWLTGVPPNADRAMRSIERIVRDTQAAAAVVQRMEVLFRRAEPVREEMDLNRAVREALDLVAEDLRAVTCDLALAPDLPPVLADRVQIQQVLVNLVRNALEAMDGTADRPRRLQVRTSWHAEAVTVEVSDSGVGISPEVGERLFESFYTTKPDGMGIGLAICRSIVESHRGRLWAEPRQPHGTCFSVALPR